MTKFPWRKLYIYYRDAILPYIKSIRGATRLNLFLGRKMVDSHTEKINGKFMIDYESLSLIFEDWSDLRELISIDPIKGYTKHFEPQKGDTVLDLGAYPGEFTVFAAKKVGSGGEVYAFEPHPDHAEKVRRNVEINELDNVAVIEKGVWSEETELKFKAHNHVGAHFVEKHSSDATSTISIDKFVNQHDLSVDFIKADIEGAEIEALKGAKKTLQKQTPSVAISSYHIHNGEKTAPTVEELLEKHGIDTFTNYPEHLTTYGLGK